MNNIALPNIFIVGPSGSGKSSSLRNMNPDTTHICNIERKQLPFKGAGKFKHNKFCETHGEIITDITLTLGTNPAIETVVIESFASLDEEILAYCRKTYSGWDVFSNHNRIIREFISSCKKLSTPFTKNGTQYPGKFVVFLGLDEILDVALPSGNKKTVRRVKVEGRELQGTIEKEFTIVLFTDVVEQQLGSKSITQYKFLTNADGVTSAKTPMGMFPELLIDNDLNMVINKVKEYFEIK